MKERYYIVTFKNKKTVFSHGFNEENAKISAQALMARKGLSYEVENIKETKYLSDMVDTDFDIDFID